MPDDTAPIGGNNLVIEAQTFPDEPEAELAAAPAQVLLIEDSEDDADLIARQLGAGFIVHRVDAPAEVNDALAAGGWDLVLSDWNVPGVDTLATLRTVSEDLPDTPHIVVTGVLPLAMLVSAMRLGARDCFRKDELTGLREAALREVASARSAARARQRELDLVEDNRALMADSIANQTLFEALHQVALAASGELRVDRLVELALECGTTLLGEVCGSLGLSNGLTDHLRIVTRIGSGMNQTAVLPISEGASGLAFSTRQSVIVNDYANWPAARPSMLALGSRSVLSVPMIVNSAPIGALSFFSLEPREFTDRDARIATMLVEHLAPAIEAASAHEAMARHAAEQDLIANLGRAATTRAEEPEFVRMALYGLADLLASESVGVLYASGQRWRVAHAVGWLERVQQELDLGADLGLAGSLAPTDQIRVALARPAMTGYVGFNIEYAGAKALILVCRSSELPLVQSELQLLGVVGAILTEYSRSWAAEHAVQESAEISRMLFESALEGVWYLDDAGATIYANARMAEILKTDRLSLQQRSIWDFTEGAALAAVRARLSAVLQGDSGRFERSYVAADGSTVWASVAASATRDRTGAVTGVVALVTDLSDRRAAEAAIADSEAKTRFLAGMSHELRTPLNSVLGFAQLLGDTSVGPLTVRQSRYLGHIRTSGQHLLELISDVLDLSKITVGMLDLAPEDLDLGLLVSDVAAQLRPLAKAKNQKLVVTSRGVARATADRLRSTQAMTNVLGNAVKFTPDGGTIRVTVTGRAARGVVTISDDGPGIASEDQAIAFDEFSTLSAGRRGEGSGLGLSITRRLLTAMGGSISLQSSLGQGSTFTIELPSPVRSAHGHSNAGALPGAGRPTRRRSASKPI